jgi:hypothetical protein
MEFKYIFALKIQHKSKTLEFELACSVKDEERKVKRCERTQGERKKQRLEEKSKEDKGQFHASLWVGLKGVQTIQ